jgi:RNA polymerase sigma-70 factor (ECF subfamily)
MSFSADVPLGYVLRPFSNQGLAQMSIHPGHYGYNAWFQPAPPYNVVRLPPSTASSWFIRQGQSLSEPFDVVLGEPKMLFSITNSPSDIFQGFLELVGPTNSAAESSLNATLAQQPPVVVETFPVSGARDIEPGETEIRVRFSKPMTDGSWSWSTAWENSTPEFIGAPHYDTDGKTCRVKVKLAPGRTYAFWLNSDNFSNFKDAGGRPAVPYLLIFQTKPK